MVMSSKKVGEKEPGGHGEKAHYAEVGIRDLLDTQHPAFHLVREGEIGNSLHHEDEPEEAEKEFHRERLNPPEHGLGARP